jgi:pimeloyl-ACP methyl ester carboxylesterase
MAVARSGDAWISWRADGEGEPVLMIMGLSGSSRAWFRLLPHVAREHRAIVFDNRGTGDSDGVTRPLKMRDLVADALAVLDAAEEETAHVIGVSMGGMVAQHLALEHRERVRSLILGCTTPGGGGTPSWRLLAGTALRPLIGSRRTFPLIAPALYADRTRRENPERVRADLELRIEDATAVKTSYAQMAAIAGHDTRARLHELEGLPVTVLHGTDDALVPVHNGRALAEGIPGATLVEFPDCGHMLTTDAEEAVVSAVLQHLKRCESVSLSA